MKPYEPGDRVRERAPGYFIYQCPACECLHCFTTTAHERPPHWQFNGNHKEPTVSPSVRVTAPQGEIINICHFFMRDGSIEYCGDSTHAFAGQTVDMVDVDD